MVIATLLPLISKDHWCIRGFDFPRLQISVGIAVILIAYLLLPQEYQLADKILLAVLSLCFLYQVYMIYPYTPFSGSQVQQSSNHDDESTISLLCTNVLMDNRDSSKLKEVIRKTDPDIILAIETDKWWIEQLSEFEKGYPYSVKQPQNNMYGMALYSKLELLDPQIEFIVQDDIPSIHTNAKLKYGIAVKLHCLHPRPPWPSGSDTSTERDVELLVVGKKIKDVNAPTIVLGDMNDVAWSKTNYLFQDISGLLDPRVGRGFYNTFHANYPFLRFPLDHFFHSNHFRLIDFKRLHHVGSDHFPVYIALSLEPDASLTQEELEADESAEKEANEKIEEGA